MRWTWTCALIASFALSLQARADFDGFDLGEGRDGDLVVGGTSLVVNVYGTLASPAAPGDRQITIDIDGPIAGALVMLIETRGPGLDPPTTCDAGPYDLSPHDTAHFELSRVDHVEDGSGARTATLFAPLTQRFASPGTQVVVVPEYHSVSIPADGAIVAEPFDGERGGVVAFLVQGELENAGLIDVSGAGFRGGAYVDDSACEVSTSACFGCTDPNEPSPRGGLRGESFASDRVGAESGFLSSLSGGGGGLCHNSGGGGGGHFTAGGHGGDTYSGTEEGSVARPVGGCGGRAVQYELRDHLVFGGGGGAGHGNGDVGTGGGNGGGAVWIRAGSLSGNGRILANGDDVVAPGSRADGQGGGGAGGLIAIRARGTIECGTLQARGGNGGDSYHDGTNGRGPGGGGGAGRIFVRAEQLSEDCERRASAGVAGVAYQTSRATGSTFGATNGTTAAPRGIVIVDDGFEAPMSPDVQDVDSCDGSLVVVPRESDEIVVVYRDGTEVARSDGPGETLRLEPMGEAGEQVVYRIYAVRVSADDVAISTPAILSIVLGTQCEEDAGVDAGESDAGESDAGESDAGVDGSEPEDAEVGPDTSTPSDPPLIDVRGGGLCAIGSPRDARFGAFFVLLGLVLLARRKRSRRPPLAPGRGPTDA